MSSGLAYWHNQQLHPGMTVEDWRQEANNFSLQEQLLMLADSCYLLVVFFLLQITTWQLYLTLPMHETLVYCSTTHQITSCWIFMWNRVIQIWSYLVAVAMNLNIRRNVEAGRCWSQIRGCGSHQQIEARLLGSGSLLVEAELDLPRLVLDSFVAFPCCSLLLLCFTDQR